MKQFFFPFAKKYNYLSRYVWHRFAIVLYWILLVAVLYGIYHSLQAPEVNALATCYQTWIQTVPSISLQTLDADCAGYPLDTGFNFGIALIGTFIASYLIQIIYYKIVLYIIFGKKIKEPPYEK
jgi:hypothetical protein